VDSDISEEESAASLELKYHTSTLKMEAEHFTYKTTYS
jgi:hypothetical protein